MGGPVACEKARVMKGDIWEISLKRSRAIRIGWHKHGH